MASYIINDNGSSGYTRAQFEAALLGKQDILVSGTNIKTIDGNSVLGSGNLTINASQQEYTYDLSELETTLKNGVVDKLNTLNPIDQSTGKRKYMMFGFITDLHTYPSKSVISNEDIESAASAMLSAGVTFNAGSTATAVADAILDNWPTTSSGYMGCTAEPSLKLLGAIGYQVGLDAVFCGGDLSDGRLPYDCYSYAMWRVKSLFDKYISVPRYFTEGNHDRWYQTSVGCRSNAQWLVWLQNILNSNGATYSIDNSSINNYVSNTYWVDFSAYKIRAIMRSQYEAACLQSIGIQEKTSGGGDGTSKKNFFDALSFANPQDAETWTVMSLSHNNNDNGWQADYLYYYRNGTRLGNDNGTGWGSSTQNMYLGFMNPVDNGGVQNKGTAGYHGKATIGQIYGHVHNLASVTTSSSNDKVYLTKLSLYNAFTTTPSSADDYKFSIFVVDSDNYQLHEIKVGLQYNTDSAGYDSTSGIFTYDYRHN